MMLAKILLCACLAFTLHHVYKLILSLGLERQLQNQTPGPCHLVSGIDDGCEDLTILPNGQALISAGLQHYAKGRLLTLNLDKVNNSLSPIQIEGDFNEDNLTPHGLSTWTDQNTGEVTLFVANHSPVGETVEVFKYNPNTPRKVKFVKTIQDPAFDCINDLVATSNSTFYVTNLVYRSGAWAHLQLLLMAKWGSIVFYDGKRGTQVAKGYMPNGINISPDNRYLYVADHFEEVIKTYKINKDNSIEQVQVLPTYSGIDNIEVDPKTGDLWVGCHPSVGIAWMKNALDWNYTSPSQVLRVTTKDSLLDERMQIYADRGHNLEGSSVAGFYNGQILIGTVGHKLMHCEVKTI